MVVNLFFRDAMDMNPFTIFTKHDSLECGRSVFKLRQGETMECKEQYNNPEETSLEKLLRQRIRKLEENTNNLFKSMNIFDEEDSFLMDSIGWREGASVENELKFRIQDLKFRYAKAYESMRNLEVASMNNAMELIEHYIKVQDLEEYSSAKCVAELS